MPFIIHADFEARTEKIQTCSPEQNQSHTEAYQKHTDCGCGYKVVCCYDGAFSKLVQICRGKNSFYKFIEKMSEEVEDCKKAAKKHLKNH